jgi:hypothetical protein
VKKGRTLVHYVTDERDIELASTPCLVFSQWNGRVKSCRSPFHDPTLISTQ